MLDEPIDVLDSYIRFVDPDRAVKAIEDIGSADVPPAFATQGRLVANLWRCGWLLGPGPVPEAFELRYTSAPKAPHDTSYRRLVRTAGRMERKR